MTFFSSLFRPTLLVCAAALSLTACAGSGRAAREAKAEPAAMAAPMGLPPQKLGEGECGLFLWSTDQPRRFIFFARAGANDAQLALGKDTQRLKLVAQTGGLFGTFTTKTQYTDQSGEAVTITLTPGEALIDGQRTQSAQILLDRDGWQTIVPVDGLTACEAAPENS